MTRRIVLWALLAALGAGAVATARADGPRTVTLDEAVALALRQNPAVAVAAAEVDAARAQRANVRGMMLPRLHLEGSVIRWDEALVSTFGPPSPMTPTLEVREAVTTNLKLQVIQPLTPLWALYDAHAMRDLGVDLAGLQQQTARRDLAYRVVESYYRLLQVMRLEEVATTSIATLEGHVGRARIFVEQGVVGKNDLLRAELALSNARQRVIQLRGAVAVSRAALAVAIGLPADTELVPAARPTAPPAREALSLEEAERRALTGRTEIREVATRLEQADRGVHFAWLHYLPQVSLVANYEHNTGSLFAQEDSLFLGVVATWDVWDWGTTQSGIDEARARKKQAAAGLQQVRDGVRLEVRAAYEAWATATEALTVAESATTQAEENFRIETKRYEANANTSFDVLDAESLLTQARAQYQAALYDVYIARAALARAMGEDPAARSGGITP